MDVVIERLTCTLVYSLPFFRRFQFLAQNQAKIPVTELLYIRFEKWSKAPRNECYVFVVNLIGSLNEFSI